MKYKRNIKRIWARPHRWRIAIVMLASSIAYYLPDIIGLIGWTSLQKALGLFHDFSGLDLYALVFFAPVVYAAYVQGIGSAVLIAMISMLVLLPHAVFIVAYPDAMLRPAAFAIILSAVGAAIAMLQKGDEERRRSMNELKCLYNTGKVAGESSSVDEFLSSVMGHVLQAMPDPEETSIRITVRDKKFESPGFDETGKKITEGLMAGDEVVGSLEIYCTRSCSRLKEQHPLIETLGEGIGGAVRRIELEQSLKYYSEQLEDMVKKRTKALEQAQGQLRLLSNTVKSSIDGITLTDMKGKLIFANEASQKMWGYNLDELTQMKMPQLYSPSEHDLVGKEIIPSSKTNTWNGELTAIRKDGSQFPVLVTTSPVHDENGRRVALVGVHRDITETKNMRDKLIRSERLAAVGELASGVGHELRNPLNVIRNCVYLLKMNRTDKDDEETLKTLTLLDQQVDISNKIVTDLLSFTRVRLPSPARVDLNNLVKETLSWVTVPENVSVRVDFDSNSPQIVADAEQVGRSFVNVIFNAVQAMEEKGEIEIATGVEDGNGWVKFKDTGCGIPKEDLDKIFEPLFSTKSKGIGLGLAIAKRLVEQNSGTIEVASQVAEGTTFTVGLPLYKGR